MKRYRIFLLVIAFALLFSGCAPKVSPPGQMPPPPPPGGMAEAPEHYDAVITFEKDDTRAGEHVSSSGDDESAVLVTDGTVKLTDMTVERTSEQTGESDAYSFFGIGAAVLSTGGTLSFEGGSIQTDAIGGAGLFAYKDGTIHAKDCRIVTRKNLSGGLHVAGGGILVAENVSAETYGRSSAPIRSDRGGGNMQVIGGSFLAHGDGSPAVYCTADITVQDAVLEATGAEAVCVEGRNSLTLKDCVLTGKLPEDDRNDLSWTVIVYQSLSGDAEIGKGAFRMEGGRLVSKNGGLFYTTNTESQITLTGVELSYSDRCDFFLACLGNTNARQWGTPGQNGARCEFTAKQQSMQGDVLWDDCSTLDFRMEEASELTGAFRRDNRFSGNGTGGAASLFISEDSRWIVTGDSVLSALENKGCIQDPEGNAVPVVTPDGKVLAEGTSVYTITVERLG